MTRSGQQNRPIHRRFRLVCVTFACLFLVVCALPRQSAAALFGQMPGYALRKAAAMKLPPAKERECRKRAMPGKAAATGGSADNDAAGLLPLPAAGHGCEPASAAVLFDDAPRHRGPGRTGGARAPPALPA